MTTRDDREVLRNFGFWNEAEQHLLSTAKVAIAGVGGDGFQLGFKLAMMGVRRFSIADPEDFETENSNRVFAATASANGRNKAVVFKEMVTDLRPGAEVEVYVDGVNPENVDAFIRGSDLVLDESELTRLEVGTMIARAARGHGIPNLLVMNVGFAAIATSFHPNGGKTFEDIMGISRNAELAEIAEMEVDFSRCLPYVPSYGDVGTLRAVQDGSPLPSISQGVDVASALGTTEAFLHLTARARNHRRKATWAPRFRYMDSYSGRAGTIIAPRFSHFAGLTAAFARSFVGANPRTSHDRLLAQDQR